VEHRLRGGEDDDGVGLDESRADAEGNLALESQRDEIRPLRIVDFHTSREAPRQLRQDEMLEVLVSGTPSETARDEDGLPLQRNAGALELRDDGRERLLPRVSQSARDGQRHGLDDDRHACSRRQEPLQRRSSEREAQRLLNGGSDVVQCLGGRRGPKDVRAVRQLDDLQPRADEKRNPHRVYGIERYRRRNVRRKPRFGQKRDESRFVSRQSVTIVA
jgi:hypothetical protein